MNRKRLFVIFCLVGFTLHGSVLSSVKDRKPSVKVKLEKVKSKSEIEIYRCMFSGELTFEVPSETSSETIDQNVKHVFEKALAKALAKAGAMNQWLNRRGELASLCRNAPPASQKLIEYLLTTAGANLRQNRYRSKEIRSGVNSAINEFKRQKSERSEDRMGSLVTAAGIISAISNNDTNLAQVEGKITKKRKATAFELG